MSAIIIRLRPWAREIKEYEKNLLHLDALFTALSSANLDLLNNSKLAYKEFQWSTINSGPVVDCAFLGKCAPKRLCQKVSTMVKTPA